MVHEIKCFKTFYIYGENTCHFSDKMNHRKKKIEKNKRKIRKEIVIMNAIRKMEVKAVLKAGELKNKFLSTKRGSQTFEFLIYAVAAVVFGVITAYCSYFYKIFYYFIYPVVSEYFRQYY